jgi:hypothetical protein
MRKYILIASLILGGCEKKEISNVRIYQNSNFNEEQERYNAEKHGLRLVDYLHLVNNNRIER